MGKLFLLAAFLVAVSADCPDDFDIVHDGKCAGTVNWNSFWDPAYISEYCNSTKLQKFNLKPVIIHNDEEQSYWTNQSTTLQSDIFLALTCNNLTKRYEWLDGTVVDYKPYNNFDGALGSCDLSSSCTSYCGPIWRMTQGTGHWTASTTNLLFVVFCTGQLPPLPTYDGCGDGFAWNKETKTCYKIGSPATDFTRAQMACADANAELASIHSTQENSFVRELAFNSGATNGVFLGGSTDENQTDFAWEDGTEWDYDNAYSGYPKEGNGECLLMDTFSSSGKWINADCSSKLPYVCVRPETPPACAPGPWKEGDKITSPGFPYDASTACDYILSVDTGKFVEVTIEELQANSCCDQLLLTDSKYGGALVAKLSGQIIAGQPKKFISASNFMRVSWQPNGAVNVKGFKMSYRTVDTREPTTTTTTTTSPIPTSKPTTPEKTAQSTTTSSSTIKPTSTTTLPTTTSGAPIVGSALMVMTLLVICLF